MEKLERYMEKWRDNEIETERAIATTKKSI